MNSMIIVGLLLMFVGVGVAWVGFLGEYKKAPKSEKTDSPPTESPAETPIKPKQVYFPDTSPDAWKIVCDPSTGKFSYLNNSGQVSSEYDTRARAEELRDYMKKWCAEYTPEKAASEQAETQKKRDQEQAQRQARFVPCQ